MAKTIRNTLIGLLVVLTLVIVLQNTEVVTYQILFWDIEMSRIIVLPLAVGVGLVVGLLLGRHQRKKRL
jgi:uncharacterized integral membrane protein